MLCATRYNCALVKKKYSATERNIHCTVLNAPHQSGSLHSLDMRLTANVLCVLNPNKYNEEQIYKLYLENYSIIEGMMCNNGDCLIVAVLSDHQRNYITNSNEMQLLTTLDFTEDNVTYLCEKIYLIFINYNKYCNEN